MSQELLYTSAPRGLKPGSRGFCTVACTQPMSAPLAAALESLSGYRHVFPPGDLNAIQNPVVWSHVKLPAAGKTYHVLSRVSDYGLDYSERTNKLAHHVVLEPRELTAGGPAWQLSQAGFMESSWEGEPRNLASGRPTQEGSFPPAVCTAWQTLAGDAGWAGVLAEAFLANPERLAYIIFEPGMNLLPLMAEAVGLIPPERRWEVTFSTYYTALPPGVVCNWRCVLADSPEANQSRRFVQALRINLCEALPPVVGGTLVAQARTGTAPPQSASGPYGRADRVDEELSDDELATELELQPVEGTSPAAFPAPAGVVFGEYGASATGEGYGVERGENAVRSPGRLPPGMPPPPPPSKNRDKLAEIYAEEARQKKRWLPVKMVGWLLVLFGIGFGLTQGYQHWKSRAASGEAAETSDKSQEDVPPGTGKSTARSATTADHEKLTAKAEEPTEDPQGNGNPPADETGSGQTPEKAAPDVGTHSNKSPCPTEAAPVTTESPANRTSTGNGPPTVGAPSVTPDDSYPTYDRKKLSPLSGTPKSYELYCINAVDKGRLEIPVDSRAEVKWALHLPGNEKKTLDIECTEKKVTLRTLRAQEPKACFCVTESDSNDQSFVLEFAQQNPSSQAIHWCVLSMREPKRSVRLFALQETSLPWEAARFKNGSYTAQLQSTAECLEIKLQIRSLKLHADGFDEAFIFRPTSDPADKTLRCAKLDETLQTLLQGNKPQPRNLPLVFSPPTDSSPDKLKMELNAKPLKAPFKKKVNKHIKDINDDAAIPPDSLKQLIDAKKGDALFNENKRGNLADVNVLISNRLNALDPKSDPNLKPKWDAIQEKTNTLDKFVDDYWKITESIDGAEIVEAVVSYEIEKIPDIDEPVSVELRYSKPSD